MLECWNARPDPFHYGAIPPPRGSSQRLHSRSLHAAANGRPRISPRTIYCYATLSDFVDKDRLSRAFGLFYTLGSVCGIAAPLGYGLLDDAFGVETAIAAIGIAIFLTVPLALLLKPARASRLSNA